MTLWGEDFLVSGLDLVINLHEKESQFGKIPEENSFFYNMISFELSNFIFHLSNNGRNVFDSARVVKDSSKVTRKFQVGYCVLFWWIEMLGEQ